MSSVSSTATGNVSSTLAPDGCLEIVIGNPAEANLLTFAMTSTFLAAISDLPEGTKFVLIRGNGADFCAGRTSPMPDPSTKPTARTIRERVADPVLDFYEALRSVPVPVIAAVSGRAFGVGCALAGLADIVIADETAKFVVPELERDIPPLLVMTGLADRIGRAALARLVLSREAFSATAAEKLGLVSETCAAGELDARIAFYRQKLSANSAVTLSAVKAFLNLSPEMSFAARRAYAADSIATAVSARFGQSA
ncbi:enoyl-CoA hydratase/isomerase family protein [Neorhizobium petrolearium]|uniref:enoyl-CoA hydratase/isomerase family protein n=1 Tax=Neorhizobium petrolearium TaxID=515361 RepID=UPI003F8054F9